MRLNELFQRLALGELSGSPLVDISGYEIQREHLPKVINFINQGLEYIYSNFSLRTNSVIIKLVKGTTRYYLDSDYSISNPNAEGYVRYVIDSLDKPFKDDVLQIVNVVSTDGMTFTLNDINSLYNVNTPEYNCVEVRNSFGQEYLLVTYRAMHPKIPLDESIDSRFKLLLPSSYATALQTYVACLLLQNMGGVNIEQSNALFAKFKSLEEQLRENSFNDEATLGVNIKPSLGGWV